MSRETIAKVLKRLREQIGLTADQVGALVGKSGKTVNAWENNRGQPDAEILMKLCDIYNVSDILAEFRENPQDRHFNLTKHEKDLITAYRNHPEMQMAVDTLLNVSSCSDKITDLKSSLEHPKKTYKIAARNGQFVEKPLSDSEIESLMNCPDVDDL